MPIYYCPLCQAPLKRHCRKDDPQAFFWSCTAYRTGCSFCCDDFQASPFLKTCPECGKILRRKISKKTGRPYVACFNKAEHASQEVLFFHDDGTPSLSGVGSLPKAKAIYTCPECHSSLRYLRIRNGRNAGKTIFLCPNAQGHQSGKARFFDDQEGEPLL